MFVDGGIHAREWAAHMSVIYLMYQLVERSSSNMQLLDNLDWVIIPIVNPDGYVYSHTTDRSALVSILTVTLLMSGEQCPDRYS
jgi:murein tripeptide amidase MpaA